MGWDGTDGWMDGRKIKWVLQFSLYIAGGIEHKRLSIPSLYVVIKYVVLTVDHMTKCAFWEHVLCENQYTRFWLCTWAHKSFCTILGTNAVGGASPDFIIRHYLFACYFKYDTYIGFFKHDNYNFGCFFAFLSEILEYLYKIQVVGPLTPKKRKTRDSQNDTSEGSQSHSDMKTPTELKISNLQKHLIYTKLIWSS